MKERVRGYEETNGRTPIRANAKERKIGGKLNFVGWFCVKVLKLARTDFALTRMKFTDRTRTCFCLTFRDEIPLFRYHAAACG